MKNKKTKGEKIIKFKCTPVRCISSTDFGKIYATNVDGSYDVKENSYGNVTIIGDLHELRDDVEYHVEALEQKSRYGYQYKVLNIKREVPNSKLSTEQFLSEILTYNQVKSLMSVYPDIVNRVMNNRLDDIDLTKTKYIKEVTFKKIVKKIVENFKLAELVDEFKGMLNFNILKKLYDKYPSTEKIKDELSKNPYRCLCGLSRIGFKKADAIILDLEDNMNKAISRGEDAPIAFIEDLRSSPFRLMSAVIFILDENAKNKGNTKMNITELKNIVSALTPECMHHFINVCKDNEEFILSVDGTISFKDLYNKEYYIWNKILKSNKFNNKEKWDIKDIEKYRNMDEFKATDDQFSILEAIINNNITILAGYSGSGKSASTKMVIEMLKYNNKDFCIFAPTGKASQVIAEYTGESASTIHRGLDYMPPDWIKNENNPIRADIVIVDEFSMTDVDLAYRLFSAIDFSRTKLMLIGDPEQLSSVGAGNLLYDMIESNIIKVVMLDKIFRYGIGGLTTVATELRNGKSFLNKENKIQKFGEDEAYVFIPSSTENIVKTCRQVYNKMLQKYKPEDILVLSPYNKGDAGSTILNQNLQPLANPTYKDNHFMKSGDNSYFTNDLCLQCVNNYKAKTYPLEYDEKGEPLETFVSNGEIGVMKGIDDGNAIINFNGQDVAYGQSDILSMKLGYAMSVHKSQGSQAKVVILVSDKSQSFMINANNMYVGVTRAKEKCFHIGNLYTINSKVKVKENKNRLTNTTNILNKLKGENK